MKKSIFIFFLLGMTIVHAVNNGPVEVQATVTNTTFSCSDSEAVLQANSVTSTGIDGKVIYVGYQQVSANNQNPIVARFDNGEQVWCRTDYETSGDDGRATVAFWNGTDEGLYIGFTATGTQGDSSTDYRRFAANGWLTSYTDGSPGGGGGAKVAVIVRVDPATGEGLEGSFITSVLSSGRTNSLVVDAIGLDEGRVMLSARSWYSPRNRDKSAMSCSGSSPFTYTVALTADLSTALSASAENCIGNDVTLTHQIYLPSVIE